MSTPTPLTIEMSDDLNGFQLPQGVQPRLQGLLDKQGQGQALTPEEQEEAEGLVNIAEWFALLQLRAQRSAEEIPPQP